MKIKINPTTLRFILLMLDENERILKAYNKSKIRRMKKGKDD